MPAFSHRPEIDRDGMATAGMVTVSVKSPRRKLQSQEVPFAPNGKGEPHEKMSLLPLLLANEPVCIENFLTREEAASCQNRIQSGLTWHQMPGSRYLFCAISAAANIPSSSPLRFIAEKIQEAFACRVESVECFIIPSNLDGVNWKHTAKPSFKCFEITVPIGGSRMMEFLNPVNRKYTRKQPPPGSALIAPPLFRGKYSLRKVLDGLVGNATPHAFAVFTVKL